jgi:hypothetical protein
MADQFNISDVFISYSRRDKSFVRTLFDRFKADGRNIWVDWEDIPPTANWWSEIEAGIEGSNTFIFIISPDSVQSKVCRDEIDHAIKSGKRFVPVLHRSVDDPTLTEVMHPAINSHNWVFFREEDDAELAYENLVRAIDTDLHHVRMHTRFLVRAREWDSRGREHSFLLTGIEIQEARAWLEAGENKQPKPSDLHQEFILTSITQQRIRQRNLVIGVMVTLVITALAVLSFALFQNAESNLSLANVRGTEARAQAVTAAFNADVALTNAADAINAQGTADANADVAATNAADAINAQSTADTNAGIAVQQAITAIAARQDAQRSANVAATSAADALDARGTADANFVAAATSAADAINAQGTADTLRLTAEGDAVQRGETAVAALATSEQRGTAIAIAQAEALQNAQRARAIALASQSQQALKDGNDQLAILLAIAAIDESAISWEAEQALAQSIINDFVPQALIVNEAEDALPVVAVAPANGLVALSYTAPVVRLWSPEEQAFITEYDDHTGWVQALAFSSDGRYLATGGRDRRVVVRDTSDNSIVATLEGRHGDAITKVVWSPDGTRLLSLGEDARALVWDIATQEVAYALEAHDGLVNDALWSTDGGFIVTGGEDSVVIVWQANDGAEIRRYTDHIAAVTSVAMTSNGRYLATGSDDDLVYVYDDTGEQVRRLAQHIGDIIEVSWSPNDRYLATASFDGTVRVWLMRENNPTATLIGHTRPITDIAWAPDNNRIATLASDATLRVWNIRQASRPIVFPLAESRVGQVAWANDGRYIFTTSDDFNPPQSWSMWSAVFDLVNRAESCCRNRVLTYEEALSADLDPEPSAPQPENITGCPSAPTSRLYPGVWGQVDRTTEDTRWLNVRIRPGVTSARVDQIAPGQYFRVLEGPECEGDYAWFQIIYGLEAETGWVAEGDFTEYFAEPVYFATETPTSE